MAPRETENNAYAKFGGQTKSIMVCHGIFWSGQFNSFRTVWKRFGEIDPFTGFSTFYMDKLGEIRRHQWKRRLKISETAKFESDTP